EELTGKEFGLTPARCRLPVLVLLEATGSSAEHTSRDTSGGVGSQPVHEAGGEWEIRLLLVLGESRELGQQGEPRRNQALHLHAIEWLEGSVALCHAVAVRLANGSAKQLEHRALQAG